MELFFSLFRFFVPAQVANRRYTCIGSYPGIHGTGLFCSGIESARHECISTHEPPVHPIVSRDTSEEEGQKLQVLALTA